MSWICPNCKRKFKNTNQAHSCSRVDIEDHLKDKSTHVQQTFEKLLTELHKFGPITVDSVKHSIMVKSSTTFVAIKPKRKYLRIEFLLESEFDEPPVYKTIKISKNRVAHFAVLEYPREVTSKLLTWLKESYQLAG